MSKSFSEQIIYVPVDSVSLEGSLGLSNDAQGLVIFAHGSGSSRHSPRNNFVAKQLQSAGLGTLLIDLLTEEEDAVYERRFDIELLVHRLCVTTRWFKEQRMTKGLPIGYFGASTGAAAALKAAASLGESIAAVVSRGGRPDLAEPDLGLVQSPTLLIVGGDDDVVIELNQVAYDKLKSQKELVIVPGASHLFEEPGTLEEAARLAVDWFTRYLKKTGE
ncbi:dienelactone hydrolase family protein [Heliobacterium chlorum]|uniref:Dienelactone hydrolase family protein n=1 Tax=Heliobacterium chlorum TaxID=2698 RepID=A0ABR7SY52_HELCL|nr:dienelactone hydrolase family protein [Heliobacterium chlorum]MBC9783463.1 dienelactone hydrolase family protein [Heliobacterium chlorum]